MYIGILYRFCASIKKKIARIAHLVYNIYGYFWVFHNNMYKEEIIKVNNAIDMVSEHLDGMYEIALEEFGEKNAEIFAAQKMLLNDTGFYSSICERIEAGEEAASAIEKASAELEEKLREIPDEVIKSKADDIADISKRLINVINGHLAVEYKEKSVYEGVVDGDSLSVSEILNLDRTKVSEIIFRKTSEFAHTVILAKAMGLNVKLCGHDGICFVDELSQVTGIEINNIFRTEFLYMNRNSLPSEEEQIEAYSKYIDNTPENILPIIRLFDLGGDKASELILSDGNKTCMLSKRGIRMALDNPEILSTQIRAILKSAKDKGVGILVPMVATEAEVYSVTQVINDVFEESKMEIEGTGTVSLGLMIETPSAVMISEKLADLCDFFMIGVNDLIQYTYACDRKSKELEKIYIENKESVIRMIEIAKANAIEAGISVGICGNTN